MKRIILSFLALATLFIFLGCTSPTPPYPEATLTYQKQIPRLRNYETYLPQSYALMDYREKALLFNQWLFDPQATGDFLPLIWENTARQEFGFGAYVGDDRGYVEGVSAIAAVMSASLLGIDMTDYEGRNYVALLSQFYSSNQRVVLNGTRGVSIDSSLWYKIYPGILFTQVSLLYPEETVLRMQALENIEQWYQAQRVFQQQPLGPNYAFTSFDFSTMEPFDNGIWKEPDSAVGIGMLMYYGYTLTGDEKYLQALKETMLYIDSYFSSPLYEILHYYAPFLATYLNAEHGMNLDVLNLINDNFDGQSVPRGGWGSLVGSFGSFPMDGLKGSIRDRGGYAFSMNTFSAAFILSSFVMYDARYASATGQWLLHLISNSRYFFPDQSDPRFQSCTYFENCGEFNSLTSSSFPYEGIINGLNGRTPWIGGDPMITGWAQTDLSIYSGASTGMLASLITPTDQTAILKLHVNRMAQLSTALPSTFLVYNPHSTLKTVTYPVSSGGPVDLFDLVSKTYIARDVQSHTVIELSPLESVLIAELPAGTVLRVEATHIAMPNGDVLTAYQVHSGITNHQSGDRVSSDVRLDFETFSDVEDDAIAEISLRIGVDRFNVLNSPFLTFNTNQLTAKGTRRIFYTITMTSGLTDTGSIILTFE